MATTRNHIPPRMDKTRPIYRVKEISYIDDKLLDPELMPIDPETEGAKPLLVEFDGHPGYNLEPWNEIAQKKWAALYPEGSPMYIDPIADLTKIRAEAPETI